MELGNEIEFQKHPDCSLAGIAVRHVEVVEDVAARENYFVLPFKGDEESVSLSGSIPVQIVVFRGWNFIPPQSFRVIMRGCGVIR